MTILYHKISLLSPLFWKKYKFFHYTTLANKEDKFPSSCQIKTLISFLDLVSVRLCFSYWSGVLCSPLDNNSISQTNRKVNCEMLQIREIWGSKICINCLLTFFWGCDIMEIPLAWGVGERFNLPIKKQRGANYSPPYSSTSSESSEW